MHIPQVFNYNLNKTKKFRNQFEKIKFGETKNGNLVLLVDWKENVQE